MAGKRGDEGTGEAKDGMVSDRGPAGGNAAASSLDRQTGVALWRQIADDIRAAIGNGVYDDSTKLPTEAALAAQFEVNRHTVRQALGALAREGIVETVQGRGTTVVRRTRFSYPIGSRTRFSAGLGGQVSRRLPGGGGEDDGKGRQLCNVSGERRLLRLCADPRSRIPEALSQG